MLKFGVFFFKNICSASFYAVQNKDDQNVSIKVTELQKGQNAP